MIFLVIATGRSFLLLIDIVKDICDISSQCTIFV